MIKEILKNSKGEPIVITSDRDIAEFAWSHGGIPVRSEDFLKKLEHTEQYGIDYEEDDIDENYTRGKGKKGASHRLSKRQKAIKRALKKL